MREVVAAIVVRACSFEILVVPGLGKTPLFGLEGESLPTAVAALARRLAL